MKLLTGISLSLGLVISTAGASLAADFPTRPVTVIVPFGAGSASDYIVRLVGDAMAESMGQPFVVENRPGASGTVGAAYAHRAAPDGYTLVLSSAAMAITDSAYPNLPYSSEEFRNIVVMTEATVVLVAGQHLGIESVDDLIGHANANPGSLTFGSLGVATSHHVTAEKFMMETGIEMVHAPYAGSGPAHADLLGGHIDVMFDNITAMLPHITSEQVVPLAVTSAERNPLLPDVPTLQETGIEDFVAVPWTGIAAPPGTDDEIIAELSRHFQAVFQREEIRQALIDRGMTVVGNDHIAAEAYLKDSISTWARVIEAAGIDLSD